MDNPSAGSSWTTGHNSDLIPAWTFERDCIVAAMVEGMRPSAASLWASYAPDIFEMTQVHAQTLSTIGAEYLVILSPLKYVCDGCQYAGIPLK